MVQMDYVPNQNRNSKYFPFYSHSSRKEDLTGYYYGFEIHNLDNPVQQFPKNTIFAEYWENVRKWAQKYFLFQNLVFFIECIFKNDVPKKLKYS